MPQHQLQHLSIRSILFNVTPEPASWRRQLLQLGLLAGLILGGIVYIPSVWLSIITENWGIVLLDTAAIVIVALLYHYTVLPYRLRAAVFVLVLYGLGAWLLIEVGSISQIYFLGFSILTTLLLGIRPGIWSVALNTVTLFGLGIAELASPVVGIIGREMVPEAWFIITLNFLLVNALLSVSIGLVLATLEGIAAREHEARIALEQERSDLVRANNALDHEIRERQLLENQLAQHQKLEAIGQLAGGIAHDFNNLLTIITGYSDLLLSSVSDADDRSMLREIQAAGDRATQLTRQLLAFSRRQMLAPQIVDLNAVVANLETLLRRLIGEHIQISIVLQHDLPQINVDPGQLEQVIINLAVNARDAMPDGGRLLIESQLILLTAEQAATRLDLQPGPYVALDVCDTGHGMPPEVQAHIYEPFFTTKAVGRGTGLGLATVFGIVKQSGAWIDLESEVGVGTHFRIFFPPSTAGSNSGPQVEAPAVRTAVPAAPTTVLLVEDEAGVRRIARLALEAEGFGVREAVNGSDALRVFATASEAINIVVTDVIMPELSGRELVEQLRRITPGLRVLYISGYTDDAILRHGILDAGEAFLQKPFSSSALVQKVQEILLTDLHQKAH